MAEIVFSFVVEQTLSRMLALVTDEMELLWCLGNEVTRLRDSLDEVRDVLLVAEQKQVELRSVKRWLNQLKDAAYDAEDVLDELFYENLRQEVNQQQKEVSKCFSLSKGSSFLKKLTFHARIAHKVRKVNELLDKTKNASSFGTQLITSPRIVPQIDPNRITDWIPEHPVVGREANVAAIMNLFTRFYDQVLTIVPIVGMGGLGKTALAQMVFKKAIDFDFKIWVCVSTNFNVQRILGEMLQTVAGKKLDNRGAILDHLGMRLMGKKFLLVLDDLWEDAFKGWEDLWSRLLEISSNNGNAIVVTTRIEEVASTVQSSRQHWHNLNFLSADDCWSIIKKKVRANGEIDPDLERIGREIARKCGGVPLAAKVLGWTLGLKKEIEAWESIRDSKIFDKADKKDCIKDILKLSFDHFPSVLKSCFSFCSIFPKDCMIEKEELIQLWMAEGFLESSNGDVGDQYFKALVGNSFFQDVERDANERVRRCKMHDLVHDLAISVSKAEILTSESSSQGEDLSCVRHVNVDMHKLKNLMAVSAKKLRTVFILKEDAVLDKSWKLKNLQSLNLKGAAIEELPSSIGEWKGLRYLDVSETELKAFPKSITKLYSLQTLRFLKCTSLKELPRERMKNMVSLKHIEFSYPWQMPSGLGRLRSLERLPMFVVGEDKGGSIKELECLNDLRGKLRIKNLDKVIYEEEAKKANLMEKKRITALEFSWYDGRRAESFNIRNDEEVLEELKPRPNIESIKIWGYFGDRFPAWVMNIMKYPNLVKLKLRDCINCKQVPSCLGILPNLKNLVIWGMDRVECLGNEFYGITESDSGPWKLFPKLESLKLGEMESLSEWKAPEVVDSSSRVEELFPRLQILVIDHCSVLTKIPSKNSSLLVKLVKLEISRCNELSYIFDELDFSSFPCLKGLSISYCSSLTLIPISGLQSLEELKIIDCWNLESVPKELASCSALTSLEIANCYRLISIPEELACCSVLTSLRITYCNELISIPEELGCCSALTSLEIAHCKRLNYFPKEIIGNLTQLKILKVGHFSEELIDLSYLNSIHHLNDSLQVLEIWGNYQTYKCLLPDQLQHLTSLKFLGIRCFHGMETLPEWLGNLSSLQSLEIYSSDLKYLPTTMKSLSKLTHLEICYCSHDLMKSLAKKSGSEWNKISHIPNINKRWDSE